MRGTSLLSKSIAGWLLLGASCAFAVPNLNGGTWQVVDPPQALLTESGQQPPLLPAAKGVYEQHLAARRAGDLSFDGTEHCLPPGVPRLLTMPGSFEFLQRPEQIIIHYQLDRLLRVIDMNVPQRPLVGPAYLGQSVGVWNGNTLVIDSIGFMDGTLLDNAGLPHGDALHATEKYRFAADGQSMTADVTIDDPEDYAAPWTTELSFRHDTNGSIPEDVCLARKKIHWGLRREGT